MGCPPKMPCEKSVIGPAALSGKKCQSIIGAWGPGFGRFPVQILQNRVAPKIVGYIMNKLPSNWKRKMGNILLFLECRAAEKVPSIIRPRVNPTACIMGARGGKGKGRNARPFCYQAALGDCDKKLGSFSPVRGAPWTPLDEIGMTIGKAAVHFEIGIVF
jgi:hypothetical protein